MHITRPPSEFLEAGLDPNGAQFQVKPTSSNSFCNPKRVCIVTVVVVVVAIVLFLTLFFTIGQGTVDCESASQRSYVDRNPYPDKCGMRDPNLFGAIIGGSPVSPGRYPWQVDLRSCGGTIVDPFHIITAAHCLCIENSETHSGDVIGREIAVGNNHPLRKPKKECGKQTRRITKFEVHESYCGRKEGCENQKPYENDIAILTVDKPFQFNSYVQPACLPPSSYPYKQGADVFVSGFGISDLNSLWNRYPTRLHGVQLPLIETRRCPLKITEDMVCAGFEAGGKDSCGGDSGGPMVEFDGNDKATLIGVVSWGSGCAEKGLPGVYAKVAYFADWLQDKLN